MVTSRVKLARTRERKVDKREIKHSGNQEPRLSYGVIFLVLVLIGVAVGYVSNN